MDKVTVIAQQGATVRGPARVKLSKDQHARRASVLGNPKRSGTYELDGSQVLQFKRGEVFHIDVPGRLNRALFDYDEPEVEEQDGSGNGSGNSDEGDT
jgi:hypothetical protein